jgi:hypothetical protein
LLGLLFAAAVFAGSGCGPGFAINTPSGFAEIDAEEDEYGYRAANAEGVVLAVRREANEPEGDLDFWTLAVREHLQRSGYSGLVVREVESADGVDGRQLRCRIEREGREHVFWVTVFVSGDRVVTVEAGGDESFFDKQAAAVERALRSLVVG